MKCPSLQLDQDCQVIETEKVESTTHEHRASPRGQAADTRGSSGPGQGLFLLHTQNVHILSKQHLIQNVYLVNAYAVNLVNAHTVSLVNVCVVNPIILVLRAQKTKCKIVVCIFTHVSPGILDKEL